MYDGLPTCAWVLYSWSGVCWEADRYEFFASFSLRLMDVKNTHRLDCSPACTSSRLPLGRGVQNWWISGLWPLSGGLWLSSVSDMFTIECVYLQFQYIQVPSWFRVANVKRLLLKNLHNGAPQYTALIKIPLRYIIYDDVKLALQIHADVVSVEK